MNLVDTFPKLDPATPITAWTNLPPKMERARIHGGAVRDFTPLLDLKGMRALTATCMTKAQLETVTQLNQLHTLCLEHHSGTLEDVGRLTKLRALSLSVFKGELKGIEALANVEYLSIFHAPKLPTLAPLAALKRLSWLSISTPPSWDTSRKTIKVESFAPLSKLTALRYLDLKGIEPKKGSLAPLENLTALRELQISHVHAIPLAQYAALAAALPNTKGHCLSATYPLPQLRLRCAKCGTPYVWLTAPPRGTKTTLCEKCDAPKVAKHRMEFERLKTAARQR